jgi:hypothetical protein
MQKFKVIMTSISTISTDKKKYTRVPETRVFFLAIIIR